MARIAKHSSTQQYLKQENFAHKLHAEDPIAALKVEIPNQLVMYTQQSLETNLEHLKDTGQIQPRAAADEVEAVKETKRKK